MKNLKNTGKQPTERVKDNYLKVSILQVLQIFLGFAGFEVFSFFGGETFSIYYRFFTVLISFFLVFILIFKRKIYLNNFMIPFFLFWFLYIIRLLYDYSYNHNLSRPPYEYLLFGILICFFNSLPFFGRVNFFTLKYSFLILFFAFFIFTILSLLNAGTFSPSDLRFSPNDKSNPITAGLISCLLVSFSLYILFERPYGIHIPRIILIISIFLGLILTILTNSKSPIIGLLLSFIIIFYKQIRIHFIKVSIFLLAFSFLFFIVLYQFLEKFYLNIILRFREAGYDQSSIDRIRILKGALNQFFRNPFLGSSIEEKGLREYPHNVLIESFMATGLIGGILFGFIYFSSSYYCLKLLKYQNFTWICLLFIQIFVCSNFSGGIGFSSNYWYIVVLISTLYYNLKDSNNLIAF